MLGLVGRLAINSSTIGSALRNSVLYLHLHDRGAVPALWVSGEQAMFAYTIYQPDVPGTEQTWRLKGPATCLFSFAGCCVGC